MVMPPPPESSLAIPSGAAAVSAWKDLDRGLRKQLLAGNPAPDGMTALVAVGYARKVLSHSRWRYVAIRLAIYLPLVIGLSILDTVVLHSTSPLPRFVAFAVLFGLFLHWRRRRTALLKMEIANAALLWPVNQPAPMRPQTSAVQSVQPLTVRYRAFAVVWPWFFVLSIWLVTILVAFGNPGVAVLLGLFALLFSYFLVRALFLGVRPGGPALHMTAQGLSFVVTRIAVPWSEISEIRFVPSQQQSLFGSRPRMYLVFVTSDPDAVLAQTKGMTARNARAAVKAYGSPLVIFGRNFDHSIEDIAAAASRFTGAPVRAYGQPVH